MASIYKAQNDIVAPIFTKPKCYCGTYFCKARMIFWHLFLQSPNAILAPISQSPILFWHLYLQSSNIILAKTITLYSKAQNYFSAKIYLHILKPPIYGKYKLLISQKYFFYKIYGNYAYFFHNQLTTKAHVYYPWQNYSSYRDGQAQINSTTRPSWASPAYMKILAAEAHVSYPVKFQYNLIAGAYHHQFQLDQSDYKSTCVQQGLNHSLLSSFPSFLMWHKAGMT